MNLPKKLNPSDPIRAAEYNAIIDCLRAAQVKQGMGYRVSKTTNGTILQIEENNLSRKPSTQEMIRYLSPVKVTSLKIGITEGYIGDLVIYPETLFCDIPYGGTWTGKINLEARLPDQVYRYGPITPLAVRLRPDGYTPENETVEEIWENLSPARYLKTTIGYLKNGNLTPLNHHNKHIAFSWSPKEQLYIKEDGSDMDVQYWDYTAQQTAGGNKIQLRGVALDLFKIISPIIHFSTLSMPKKMHIVLTCSDNRYRSFAEKTLCHAIKNSKHKFEFSIFSIKYITSWLDSGHRETRFTLAPFAKVLAPWIISTANTKERILSADVDLLIKGDIMELENLDLHEAPAAIHKSRLGFGP